MPSYAHVVVLSYSDELDHEEADSRTLVTLLHLRDIAERNGRSFSIVSEMLDDRNRELGTGVTYYELLHGIVQHDAYHAGQIAILKKMLNA